MNHEFKIVISPAASLTDAADPVPAFEQIAQAADTATAAAMVAASVADRLARAAASAPAASLESLAAATRQAQASDGADARPMAGLANAPEELLATLGTGFGFDPQAKIISGVEEIGRVFAESWQRGPEPAAGGQPSAAEPGAFPTENRSAGSADPAARSRAIYGGVTGQLPAAPRTDPGDPTTDAHLAASADPLGRWPGKRRHGERNRSGRPGGPRHGGRERFTIHGDRDGDAPGGGLHTGGLTTGNLGGNSETPAGKALADPAAAHFGSAASVLAAAPTYVPSFPTATAAIAPALDSQPPSPSPGPGAAAGGDPLDAAATKLGDGAQDQLGRAGQTLDQLSQKLGATLDTFLGRLQRVEEQVDTALSQNENRA